jgi:hypothetical protein
MKKVLLLIVCLISSSLFLYLTGCDNINPANGSADNNPQESDFNFIFKYGVTAKNELDTFKGKFTKDMITDLSITIELSLSEVEKESIYQKMVEIDFFSYPGRFKVNVPPGELTGMVTPYSTYYFKVEYNSQVKELWWGDEITNPDQKAEKLRELIMLIRNIVESKEEYKQLPEPRSGYL